MSLSAALRAAGAVPPVGSSSGEKSKSTAPKSLLSTALSSSPATAAAAPLHFFPLPRAPTWRRRQLIGAVLPPPSAGHTLTLMNHGRTLVLYGGIHGQLASASGSGASSVLGPEFFLLDARAAIGAPVRVAVAGPRSSSTGGHAVRVAHAATRLSEHALYVHGGWNGAKYVTSGAVVDLATMTLLFEHNNTSASCAGLLSSSSPQQTSTARVLPPPRRDHSVVSLRGKAFLLFGGWDGEDALNDMWICQITRRAGGAGPTGRSWVWSPYTLAAPAGHPTGAVLSPSPRRGACMVRVGRRVFLFGGLSGYSTYRNDLHILDLASRTWSSPLAASYAGTPPSPRAWATAVSAGPFVLVFGGVGPTGFLNDLHLLDTEGRRWYALLQAGDPASGGALPAPRAAAAASLVGSTLWLHGGFVRRTISEEFGGSRDVVVPCGESWSLETRLTPAADSSDDDSEDDDDPDARAELQEMEEYKPSHDSNADSDEKKNSTSYSGARSARVSMQSTPPRTAPVDAAASSGTTSPTPPNSSSAAALVEGWLGVLLPGGAARENSSSPSPLSTPRSVVSASSTSSASSSSVAAGAAASIGAGVSGTGHWGRRLVRLEKQHLSVLQLEERTNIPLTEGLLTEWHDVHASAAEAAKAARTATQDSIEWIAAAQAQAAAAASATSSISLPPGAALADSLAAFPSTNRGGSAARGLAAHAHEALLARVLDSRDHSHVAFRAWLQTLTPAGQTPGQPQSATPSALSPGQSRALSVMGSSTTIINYGYLASFHVAVDAFKSTPLESGEVARRIAQKIVDEFLLPTPPATTGGAAATTLNASHILTALPPARAHELRVALRMGGVVFPGAPTSPVLPRPVATGGAPALSRSVFDAAQAYAFRTLLVVAPHWSNREASNAKGVARGVRGRGSQPRVGFVLKHALDETDRDVAACAHCLLRFTWRATRHRSFCQYCHDVLCDACVENQVALPSDLQRLVLPTPTGPPPAVGAGANAAGVAHVRVCDMCEYVLTARSRLEQLGGSKMKKAPLHAFSYASTERKHPPLHLAAESAQTMREWMDAIGECIGGSGTAPAAHAEKDRLSPEKVSRPSSGGKNHSPSSLAAFMSGGAAAASSSGSLVYKAGWLMKEDDAERKLFKRHYCILSGGTLTFFEAVLRKSVRLTASTSVRVEKEQVNIGASGWGSGSDSTAAPDDDPNRWPTVYPIVIEETAAGTSPAAASNSAITLAAHSPEERTRWTTYLRRDVQALGEALATSQRSLATNPAPSARSADADALPPTRFRSVSTPSIAASTVALAAHAAASHGTSPGPPPLPTHTHSLSSSSAGRFSNSLPASSSVLTASILHSHASAGLPQVSEEAEDEAPQTRSRAASTYYAKTPQ